MIETYVPYKIGKLQIQGFSEPTTPKNKITELSHYAEGRPVKTTGGLFAWKGSEGGRNFLKNNYKIFKQIFVQDYRNRKGG